MIALDTTFLLDYLDGTSATEEFLDAREDEPFYVPTLVLFEVFRGVARAGPDHLERVGNSLDWVDPLSLTAATAREAALVESELLEEGAGINLGDVLVAGICRHNGARLVTRDPHFDRVSDLTVERY